MEANPACGNLKLIVGFPSLTHSIQMYTQCTWDRVMIRPTSDWVCHGDWPWSFPIVEIAWEGAQTICSSSRLAQSMDTQHSNHWRPQSVRLGSLQVYSDNMWAPLGSAVKIPRSSPALANWSTLSEVLNELQGKPIGLINVLAPE